MHTHRGGAILVAGATGNVGAELVRHLAAAGEPVRALVRDDARRAALPAGVEGVVGDLNDPASLAPALDGARAVHLLAGYAGLPDALERMRAAGVERVTLQSSSAVPSGDLTNAVARYHIESEAAIRASGLQWTFLQPNGFMSNALQWADQVRAGDVVRAPFANVRTASIDPRDIAAVAATALTADGHAGRSYRLSGPESLLTADRVAILGRVLGRSLRFEAQPDDEAHAEMSAAMPAEYVDAFFAFFVDGTLDESEVLPTVEQVTGRPPRTFAAWAAEHAGAFR
jgi:uncharacterized protein YbjT (DUF2867 family)